MSLFQRSKNLSLWRSINRVHNNLSNQIAGGDHSIIDIFRTDYYSQNIHSQSEMQEDIININEDIKNEGEDIKNTDKFYKKGEMSYWCDN